MVERQQHVRGHLVFDHLDHRSAPGALAQRICGEEFLGNPLRVADTLSQLAVTGTQLRQQMLTVHLHEQFGSGSSDFGVAVPDAVGDGLQDRDGQVVQRRRLHHTRHHRYQTDAQRRVLVRRHYLRQTLADPDGLLSGGCVCGEEFLAVLQHRPFDLRVRVLQTIDKVLEYLWELGEQLRSLLGRQTTDQLSGLQTLLNIIYRFHFIGEFGDDPLDQCGARVEQPADQSTLL
mmetsp:Transcript_18974/g.45763  ORF Transcript_18974/g.45763 Transcript_18974/m.45763 type:complete len:232 (+) Transcript_18974:813-1508(+)